MIRQAEDDPGAGSAADPGRLGADLRRLLQPGARPEPDEVLRHLRRGALGHRLAGQVASGGAHAHVQVPRFGGRVRLWAPSIGVSLIVFVVLRILPGDPLVAILGVEGHTKMTPADRAQLMQDLGLSDSLPVQYVHWLATSPAGSSASRSSAATPSRLILHRGPLTAEIAILALVISWLVGLPVGILSAIRPNGWADNVARSLSILFIAIPGFWLGMLIVLALLFWFGYKAPISSCTSGRTRGRTSRSSSGRRSCSGSPRAPTSRACRARACSRSSARTTCARPAPRGDGGRWCCATPCPTRCCRSSRISGVLLGFVLGGSVAVEQAFGVPGLGSLARDRDRRARHHRGAEPRAALRRRSSWW